MLKKLYSILPMLVFLIFLAAMAVMLFFLPHKEYSENEKRNLAGVPEVTVDGILDGSVQEDLETFTADQIPGRDLFVGVNAYWNLATGRNAAQDIYYGKDGYLINAPKPLDEKIFSDNLTRFDDFAAQQGIPADLLMVPSGGYLMEDKLPPFHGAYHDDALHEKAQELLHHTQVIDVREALKTGAETRQVCYRTDHHLTSYGNYLLYQQYQNHRGQPFLSEEDFNVYTHDGFYGTTWSGSGYWKVAPDQVEVWDSCFHVEVTFQDGGQPPKTTYQLFYPDHLKELDKYPVFLDGNHSMVHIHSPQAPEGSILLVRDSYAHCMSTFLSISYEDLYLVDLRYYRNSLSEFLKEHPVDRILYLYGVDNLVSDTNSSWLN